MELSKTTNIRVLLFFIVLLNTVMICLLTIWSLQDRRALNIMTRDIQELKKAVELEIKLREEILPQIKKSASLLSKYNPELDNATALSLAAKIYACSDESVPHDILTALIVVESGADHKAVSNKGALGLTQVLPQVWGQYPPEDLLDPYKNIEAGASILKWYVSRYGLVRGLRAYHSGPKYATRPDMSTMFIKKIVTIASEHF
ncbi:MAG: transglycosylase SLT domain-containing protein [Desulfobacterota bacterium]|nr:transglycosylase SLT domain-containing protein [Thermodesulfobacteriota bacterium]